MKFLINFFLVSIISISIHAQAVLTGTVNNTSNTPVAYAIVRLQRLPGHPQQVLQTDSTGSFRFAELPTGAYVLNAAATGYQTAALHINIERDTVVSILLQPSTTRLGEVTVTAGKPAIENDPDKLVYNVASNITATGSNVLEAIAKVPGIKVNDNEISITGKGAVKVLINDRLVQLAGIDLVRYLKSMSASQISKIELIKNPSAQYDAEGNAGLINITTRQRKKEGYSGTVQANAKGWLHNPAVVYGTRNYEALNASATLNYNAERWSAYGSINLDQDQHLEGFRTTIWYPKQTWIQSDTGKYTYLNANIIAGADYKISRNTSIGFNYQGGKNMYDGGDYVNNPVFDNATGKQDSIMKTRATYHPIADNHSINLHSAINFDTTGRRLLLNADYFSYYRTDRSDFESNNYLGEDITHPSGTTRYYDDNKQRIHIYTLKADMELPTRFAKFMLGGKLSFIDTYSNAFYYKKNAAGELEYDTNLSNEFDYKENTQALYISMNKEQGSWKYEAGLRGELTQTTGYSYTLDQRTQRKYLRLFPSLSVSWQANADNSLAFALGRRINRPSFWNLNPFKSLYTAYSYGEGNPSLNPEYNTNIELSHTFRNRFTSSLFFNKTDDGFNNVTLASADTNLVYTIPLNFIRTYRYGISENVSFTVFNWLDNNNQVTFYHTDAQSAIPQVSSISGWGLYLATNNNIYFNRDKTFAAAVNCWYQFPEINHIGRSDAYFKLDIGLKASVMKKKVDIALTMNDICMSSAVTINSTINGARQQLSNFQLNRYLLLGISYRFGGKAASTPSGDTGNQEERGRVH